MKTKPGLFSVILWLAWFLALAAPPAHGAATVSTAHATVTLLSEQPQATPGQTLWLGLRFELIPHWHVYWRNPGASGAAPVIRWTLPAGWTAGDLHWPVPQRIRVGPLTNYGYEEAVTLLAPVRVPEGPLPAGPLTLTADAEWLVCRVECIPETGRFTLELPHPGSPTVGDPATQRLFAAARAQWPEADRVTGRYRLAGDARTLTLEVPGLAVDDRAEVWFAADEWGPVDPSGAQSRQTTAEGLALRVPAGDLPPAGDVPLDGLVVVETRDGGAPARRGYAVRLEAQPAATGASETLGLMAALGFALLGGLILNVMPCVLPVLGIKVLGFVREAGANHRRRVGHGLSYGAGILLSVLALAAALLLLRAGGASLGWGFQLQSPVLVALLAYLMLLVGLNLSGVFTVGAGLMGAGQALTAGSGLFNTFATGVLAAVVASPCTAPFMGTALGFALTRPAGEALAVFLALGVGFALPVMLLSLWPARSPVVAQTRTLDATLPAGAGIPAVCHRRLAAVGAQPADRRPRLRGGLGRSGGGGPGRLAVRAVAAPGLASRPAGRCPDRRSAAAPASLATPDAAAPARADPERLAWSEARVRELTAAGRPVFVNFTAAWCITCQVNERVALATENTRRLFADRAVAYLVADWTRRDPAITRQLERHGRSGVPLYLWYAPASETPVVLPPLLTEGIVAEALQAL